MKLNLSYLILSLTLVSALTCKRAVLTAITQHCKTNQELLTKKDQDAEANELMRNTNSFVEYLIQPNTTNVGEGAFGGVFLYDYILSANDQQGIRPNAVKVITLPNDATQKEGLYFQDMYKKELDTSITLNGLDQNNLYFPRYDGCVEVTQDFETLMKEQSTENTDNINTPDDTVTFLYYTQKLDTDLFKFTKNYIKQNGSFFNQINRVQLGINTIKGLILMNEKYQHCDIKPENMMLKNINEEEASRLNGEGLTPIETSPGHTYQSFIIDFGLAVPKNSRCIGGTPGFLAQEFFTSDSHKNIDTYAVGMMLIDNELASLKIDNLSDILAVSQSMKYKQKTVFAYNDKLSLNNSFLIKNIKVLLDHDQYSEQNRNMAKEIYPNIKSEVASKSKSNPWDSSKLSTYMYLSPLTFEALVMTGMSGFNYLRSFTKDINDSIDTLKGNITKYTTAITKHEDANANTDKLLLANAMLRVQNSTKIFRRAYYDILYQMIVAPHTRITLGKALEQIENLLTKYKSDNKIDLKNVDIEIVKRITDNQSAQNKENLDKIMESRRNRMNSIYARRRLVL